jgi:hypothetical protein
MCVPGLLPTKGRINAKCAQSLLAAIKTGGFKKLNKPLLRSMHASYEAEGKTIIDEDETPTQEIFNIVISELEKKLQTQ